ncbi:hypothetical protein [Synoicihabitans lomoniglobus]|uniref:Lipoprotein n=1 Tax=Synoicihabitans lomoniglobus TaxID=2909285 RepID=A0AAF0CN03_9BACT|nr:hypothetical protein [Opitutaceae bacterium LMO-M01]WED64848.1 hypothetical protein PXH66_21085 [Opitutaceae bacterium LMO-M01]
MPLSPLHRLGLAATLLFMVAGCGAPSGPATPGPQPVISAEAHYFDNQIHVIAELGPFRFVDALPPDRLGGIPVVIDDQPLVDRAPRRYADGRFGGDGARPRQSLTVTVRNAGTQTIKLRVAEVRSALGNFIPVPEVFTLEPGQLQALEPMRASYPVAIDQLELVVRLRTADAEALQTLVLRL